MSSVQAITGNNVRYNAHSRQWEEILVHSDGTFCVIGVVCPIQVADERSLHFVFFSRNGTVEQPIKIATLTECQLRTIKEHAEQQYASAQRSVMPTTSRGRGRSRVQIQQRQIVRDSEDYALQELAQVESPQESADDDDESVKAIIDRMKELLLVSDKASQPQVARLDCWGRPVKSFAAPDLTSLEFLRICNILRNMAKYLRHQTGMAKEYNLLNGYVKTNEYNNHEDLAFQAYEDYSDEHKAVETSDELVRWMSIVQRCCTNEALKVWNITTNVFQPSDQDFDLHLNRVTPEDEVLLQYLIDHLREVHDKWECQLDIFLRDLGHHDALRDENSFNDLGWVESTYQCYCSCLPLEIAAKIETAHVDANMKLDLPSSVSRTKNPSILSIVKFVIDVLTNKRTTVEAGKVFPSIIIPEGSSFWDELQALPIYQDQIAATVSKIFAKSFTAVTSYLRNVNAKDKPLVRLKWEAGWEQEQIPETIFHEAAERSGIPVSEIEGLVASMKGFLKNRHNSPMRLIGLGYMIKFNIKLLLDLKVISMSVIHNLETHIYPSFCEYLGIQDLDAGNFFEEHLAALVIREIEKIWPYCYLQDQSMFAHLSFFLHAGRDYFNFCLNGPINKSETKTLFVRESDGVMTVKLFDDQARINNFSDSKGVPCESINLHNDGSLKDDLIRFTSCVVQQKRAKTNLQMCISPSDSRDGITAMCLSCSREAFPDYGQIHVVPKRFLEFYVDAKEIRDSQSGMTKSEKEIYIMTELLAHRVAYFAHILAATNANDVSRVFISKPQFEWRKILDENKFLHFLCTYCCVGQSRVKISLKGIIHSSIQRAGLKLFLGKTTEDFGRICKNLETIRLFGHTDVTSKLSKEELLEMIGLSQQDIENNSHFFLHDLDRAGDEWDAENIFFPLQRKIEFLNMIKQENTSMDWTIIDSYEASQELSKLLKSIKEDDSKYLQFCRKFYDRIKPSARDCRLNTRDTFEVAGACNKNSCFSNIINPITTKFDLRHANSADKLFAACKANGIILPQNVGNHLQGQGIAESDNLLSIFLQEQLYASFLINFLYHPHKAKLGLFLDADISTVILEPQSVQPGVNWSEFLMQLAFLKLTTNVGEADKFIRSSLVVSARQIEMTNILKTVRTEEKFATSLKAPRGNLENVLTTLAFPANASSNFQLQPIRAFVPLTLPPEHGGYPTHYEALKIRAGLDSLVRTTASSTHQKRKRTSGSDTNSPSTPSKLSLSESPSSRQQPKKLIFSKSSPNAS